MTMSTMTPTVGSAELEDVVRSQMERWSVPGVALGIWRDGEVETYAFGLASIDTQQPVTPQTLFQIGSISKVYTATLCMMLVEQGTLDLDTPISHYLPALQFRDEAAQQRVTLRHLLSHTAGFYGDRFDDYGPGDDALSKAIASFNELRQLTAPNELWTYCNTGFQAAGALIEQALGTTVEQAIRERVFKPLGLERSFFFAHEAITYPAAVGHNQLPGKDLEVARPYQLPRCMHAAGAIISTPADLLRFASFHLGDGTVDGKRLLGQESIQTMQTPQTEAGSFADHYGLGWALRSIDGTRVVSHGGSTNGFRAELALVPTKRFAIALLTNGNHGTAANSAIERWALERYAGLKPKMPPTIVLAPEVLERFAGVYEQPLSTITVTPLGAGLRIEVVSRNPFNGEEITLPPEDALPIGDRRFRVSEGESEGSTIDFIAGEGERPRFIRLHGRLADPKD
jgi:CubicO group peptidase (beta-lactamase class C family)